MENKIYKMVPKNTIVRASMLAGPMVQFGTYRQITDTVLEENGINTISTGVEIPLSVFLIAVIDLGLMSEAEVNEWIDKKNKEYENGEGNNGK